MREAIRGMDATAVIHNLAPMSERVKTQTSRSRFITWLMGLFAGVALLLAVIGIYGVMSHAVTRRTQEIGVRIALGARRAEIRRMIGRRALLLASLGIAIGAAAALALTRLLSRLLFEVSATDPLVFGGVALILLAAAMAGSYLPARRATRVDPMVALRYE